MKQTRFLGIIIVTLLAVHGMCRAAVAGSVPRMVNIINFVRAIEPRPKGITEEMLFETTCRQWECMQRQGLRGTFLLQYDALINPRYQELMRSVNAAGSEVGAWWEITQPHVEAAGMKWRGRYPWDWHANVGFATGYTPEERLKLVDVYMEKFKEVFGQYPHSVGSWFIDAHTLKYMHDKYHIVASCNCRDQIGTDGYTLWGGYWQGAYYPSVNNAYIPAQTKEEQIDVPVFRMLGSDPLHQYDNGIGGASQGVFTLEPVWSCGKSETWVDWFLNAETRDPAIGYTYFQAGQENSFTWPGMRQGYEMQMSKIGRLAKERILSVATLEESGRWFSRRYALTPSTVTSALSDYSPQNAKTLWYNSRYYRTNLYWEGGRFRFRDIQVYNQHYQSPYLNTAGSSTQVHYYALPIVDGCLWSDSTCTAGLRILSSSGSNRRGEYAEIECARQDIKTSGKTSIITLTDRHSNRYIITLREKNIEVTASTKESKYCLEFKGVAAKMPRINVSAKFAEYSNSDGARYTVRLKKGSFSATSSLMIIPQNGKITMLLSQEE